MTLYTLIMMTFGFSAGKIVHKGNMLKAFNTLSNLLRRRYILPLYLNINFLYFFNARNSNFKQFIKENILC